MLAIQTLFFNSGDEVQLVPFGEQSFFLSMIDLNRAKTHLFTRVYTINKGESLSLEKKTLGDEDHYILVWRTLQDHGIKILEDSFSLLEAKKKSLDQESKVLQKRK